MGDLIFIERDGVRFIKFNKPSRRNALTPSLYRKIGNILNEDAGNNDIVVTVITGSGEYFTSGNDVKASLESLQTAGVDVEATTSKTVGDFKCFVDAFINYPKIIIAVVNGPAIGVGVTMLGLCDVVYATENATFHTPFVQLGLCMEACSSLTLPRIMGRSRASEMLLLGKEITAQEALECGLVSRIIPQNKLEEFIKDLWKFGTLPVNSVQMNKKLLSANSIASLLECNEREVATLRQASVSEEFISAVVRFMSRKNKL